MGIFLIKKAYGIVGMPGSGKSEIIKVARELNIPVFSMGDAIRNELKEKGIDITPENMGRYMLVIRKNFGLDIVAKKTFERISECASDKIIIDGLRNYEEIEFFKSKIKHFYIIAVHSSPKTRFLRLKERKREDDSDEWKVFLKRDERELSVGIGKVIALADFILDNEKELKVVQEEFKKLLLNEK